MARYDGDFRRTDNHGKGASVSTLGYPCATSDEGSLSSLSPALGRGVVGSPASPPRRRFPGIPEGGFRRPPMATPPPVLVSYEVEKPLTVGGPRLW
jgi:hypothetical protein